MACQILDPATWAVRRVSSTLKHATGASISVEHSRNELPHVAATLPHERLSCPQQGGTKTKPTHRRVEVKGNFRTHVRQTVEPDDPDRDRSHYTDQQRPIRIGQYPMKPAHVRGPLDLGAGPGSAAS